METVDTFSKLVESLYGLPRDIIVGLFGIVVGYVIRLTDWVENRRIPAVVVIVGMIGSPLVAIGTYTPEPMIPQIIIHGAIGAIIGFVAWIFHNKILSRFEEKIPFLGRLLSDAKPDKPVEP